MKRPPELNRRILRSSNGSVRVEAVWLEWLHVTVYGTDGWPVRRGRFTRHGQQLRRTLRRGGIDEDEAAALAAEILRDPPRPAVGVGRLLLTLALWWVLAVVGAGWLLYRLLRSLR